MSLLNLDDIPEDAIERLAWLSGVHEQVRTELDAAYQEAYYVARLEQRFDSALALGLHSAKKALAFSRAENEKRGRTLRWGDLR